VSPAQSNTVWKRPNQKQQAIHYLILQRYSPVIILVRCKIHYLSNAAPPRSSNDEEHQTLAANQLLKDSSVNRLYAYNLRVSFSIALVLCAYLHVLQMRVHRYVHTSNCAVHC
jgi:hypothetical protein